MTRQHDPLDQLIREALGEPANPAPARRACRAALRLVAADERRRERRRLQGLTVAAGLALMFGLAGPLGSDDFNTDVYAFRRNGMDLRVYTQGLRSEKVKTAAPGTRGGFTEAQVEELFQQRAAGQYTIIALFGMQIGETRYFEIMTEHKMDDGFALEDHPAEGMPGDEPRELKEWYRKAGRGIDQRLDAYREGHAPDFTRTMYLNNLLWNVDAWRIKLPGLDEIVCYRGLRADGVRTEDPAGI